MAYHIFQVLTIKDLINGDGELTMTFKLATGVKPSIFHLRVLFFSCVLFIATAHVGKKAVNMRYQAQKCFCNIFIGIPHNQKGCLFYVPHKRNIISSYDVVFDESFSSALAYTSQPYAEAVDMRPYVSYIPYDTSSKEQSGNIIIFTQFEEGGFIIRNS